MIEVLHQAGDRLGERIDRRRTGRVQNAFAVELNQGFRLTLLRAHRAFARRRDDPLHVQRRRGERPAEIRSDGNRRRWNGQRARRRRRRRFAIPAASFARLLRRVQSLGREQLRRQFQMGLVVGRRRRQNRHRRRAGIVVDQRGRSEDIADQRFTFIQSERIVHLKRIAAGRRLRTNRSRLLVIAVVVQEIRRFTTRRAGQLTSDVVLVGLRLSFRADLC